MDILKTVDWKSKGVERIRWEIVTVPEGSSIEDFIKKKSGEGWEVIGKTKDAAKRPALFVEMDAVFFDRNIKPIRTKEKNGDNSI